MLYYLAMHPTTSREGQGQLTGCRGGKYLYRGQRVGPRAPASRLIGFGFYPTVRRDLNRSPLLALAMRR